jgi:hypothetical protein
MKEPNTRNYWNSVMLVMLVVLGIFFPVLQQSIFANPGKEIELEFSNAQFLTLPDKGILQIKFTAIYSVLDLTLSVSTLME